jgi:hypothetical protein
MQRWTSDPLAVPRDAEAPFFGADLEFEDVAHDGPSFVVRLYLNQADVADDAAPGDAGHFTVFAHGDCWGDVGHCDVPAAVRAFERPHPLAPINVSVDVTDALAALPDAEEVTVTALAQSLDEARQPEPLRFKRLTLVTYE